MLDAAVPGGADAGVSPTCPEGRTASVTLESATSAAAEQALRGRSAAEPEAKLELLQPIVALLLLLLAMATDMFGLRTATDVASRDAFLKLYSYWYGRPDFSDEIVVVTFREDDLTADRSLQEVTGITTRASNSWPLTFADRSAMLKALVEAQPAAIFIDLIYVSDNNHDPDYRKFVDALQAAVHDGKVPIVLADVPDNGSHAETIAAEIRATGVDVAMAGWLAPSGLYPLSVSAADGEVADGSRIRSDYRPTPAAFLYAVHQHRLGLAPTPHSPSLSKGTIATASRPCPVAAQAGVGCAASTGAFPAGPPMRIAWGFDPERTIAERENCPRASFCSKGEIFFRAFGGPKESNLNWLQPTRCLYHRDVGGADLFMWATNNTLGKQVGGKYVFVGASLNGMPDWWISPVHGKVPGVHAHAMAFDNLVRWGSAYLRDPIPAGSRNSPFMLTDVVELALMLGISWGSVWLRSRRAYRNARTWERGRQLAIALLAFVALATACSAALLMFSRMIPVNWIGLSVVALVAIAPSEATLVRWLLAVPAGFWFGLLTAALVATRFYTSDPARPPVLACWEVVSAVAVAGAAIAVGAWLCWRVEMRRTSLARAAM